MRILIPLAALIILVLIPYAGVSWLKAYRLFSIAMPYAAALLFVGGVIFRVLKWASAPVPFRIPTSCGQQKSLAWIRFSRFDNPHRTSGVLGRMVLEVLTFRSLFRNSRLQKGPENRLAYSGSALLWVGALAFHYSLLAILVRHVRFFAEPVPFFVAQVQNLDGFLQIGTPRLYLTSLVIVASLSYLLLRRAASPELRYISLPADWFALFLLLGIALTGDLMRYFMKVDVVKAKELVMGLVRFRPVPLETMKDIGPVFYVHLFLVSVLAAWFPASKLMHMGGVFLSPTLNLANNSRRQRHVNPWDFPVEVHTYQQWEDEFRDKLKAAGMPLEREKQGTDFRRA